MTATRTRALLVLLVVAQIVTLGVLGWSGEDPDGPRAGIQRGGDFLSWWAGAAVVEEHGPGALYDRRLYEAAQDAVVPQPRHYRQAYPPPIFSAVATLLPLGYGNAARVFLVGSALGWGIGIALMLGALGLPRDPRSSAMLLALGSPALFMVSVTGQGSGVWVLLLGLGLHLRSKRSPVLAGVVLGLLCAKPGLALPVAAALLLSGDVRGLSGFAGGGAALVAMSAALVGLDPWMDWVELVRSGGLAGVNTVPHRHLTAQSLVSLPGRKTPAYDSLQWIGLGVGLACAVFAAWRAGRPRPEDRFGSERFAGLLSVCLFASPHLVEYDAGMHAAAFAATAVAIGRRPSRIGWGVLALAWIAPALWPISKELNLGFGALAVGLWLAWLTWADPWGRSHRPESSTSPPA